MKITKTKLREMIKQELNEISGLAGTSRDLKRLRQHAADMKAKLKSKETQQVAKTSKQKASTSADRAYTDAVAAYDTKAADYTKQAAAAAEKASAYSTKLSTYNTKASEVATALSTRNTALSAARTAKTAKTTADTAYSQHVAAEPKTSTAVGAKYAAVNPIEANKAAAYRYSITQKGQPTIYKYASSDRAPYAKLAKGQQRTSNWEKAPSYKTWDTGRATKLATKNTAASDYTAKDRAYSTALSDYNTKNSALGGYETLKQDALTAKQAADTLSQRALDARTAADTLKKSRKATKTTAKSGYDQAVADYEAALRAMSDAEKADAMAKAETSFAFGAGGAGGAGGFGAGAGGGGGEPGKATGKKGKKGKGKKKKDESLHRILGRDLISEIDEIKKSIKIQRKVKK